MCIILRGVLYSKFYVNWIRPALPASILADQFTFQPIGSTTCVFVHFMHHVSLFLEANSYVRVLYNDFSKAFDIVDHVILLPRLVVLGLPPVIVNWVMSFLMDCNQMCQTGSVISILASINMSIMQISMLGPLLYSMEEDLHPILIINILFKYVDDTNLIVTENTDVS